MFEKQKMVSIVEIDVTNAEDMRKFGLELNEDGNLDDADMDEYIGIINSKIEMLIENAKGMAAGNDGNVDTFAVYPREAGLLNLVFPGFEIGRIFEDDCEWEYDKL